MEANTPTPEQSNFKLPQLLQTNALTISLFIIVLGALILIGFILLSYTKTAMSNYDRGLNAVFEEKVIDTNSLISISKTQENGTLKACGILIGFILIFTGALFLFKIFNSSYTLNYEHESAGKFLLKSSSPGLILSTLGTIIVVASIISKNKLEYYPDPRFIPKDFLTIAKLEASSSNQPKNDPVDSPKRFSQTGGMKKKASPVTINTNQHGPLVGRNIEQNNSNPDENGTSNLQNYRLLQKCLDLAYPVKDSFSISKFGGSRFGGSRFTVDIYSEMKRRERKRD